MYSRSNDKRIPAEINIPENYRGNVFSSGHASNENNDSEQCKNSFEQERECNCNNGCEHRDKTNKAENDIEKQCRNDLYNSLQNDSAQKKPPCEHKEKNNEIFNIGIGTEELLILGVMALVFFSGDSRDNELLVCLLLVLLM